MSRTDKLSRSKLCPWIRKYWLLQYIHYTALYFHLSIYFFFLVWQPIIFYQLLSNSFNNFHLPSSSFTNTTKSIFLHCLNSNAHAYYHAQLKSGQRSDNQINCSLKHCWLIFLLLQRSKSSPQYSKYTKYISNCPIFLRFAL